MTIRNDATRPEADLSTKRRPRSVVARQGQVLLDIDVTTAGDLAAERSEIDSLDTLGRVAAPFDGSGFTIFAGGTISPGRLYLDGMLVENLAMTTLTTQPHPADPLPAGPAIVGLKALVRLVDPVEDRRLTDKGLGDAVTSGRELVDWQVLAVPLTGAAPATCGALSADWDNMATPSSGRLSARVDPGVAAANFCTPAAGGGYARLENLLYRIEVDGGVPVGGFPTIDGPRFGLVSLRLKMSRRNASVMTRIGGYTGRELTVDPPALDAGQWFAAGGAAEIVSIHDDVDPRAAAGQTRLFTVARAADNLVTLAGTGALPLPAPTALGEAFYLRLWDTFPNFAISATASGTPVSAEIDCGDGVLITVLAAASHDTVFRRGDWWSFTARVDGTIDWPVSAPNTPIPRTPDGPAMHYVRLAAVDGPAAVPVDCRPEFLPLTKQQTLLYCGGDGQSASLTDDPAAFVPLRDRLRVAVLRGGLPVPLTQVRWSTPTGAPASQVNGAATPVTTTTDANGLTEVTWALDRTGSDVAHGLIAEMINPPGRPITPVRFGASFTTAKRTSYVPGCTLLTATNNVQDALDLLCNSMTRPLDNLGLKQITLVRSGRNLIDGSGLLLNGIEVPTSEMVEGLRIELDGGPLETEVLPDDPIVDLEIELPYPITERDTAFWSAVDGTFGTLRLRVDGVVKMGANLITFEPTPAARRFLTNAPQHHFGVSTHPRYLARLRLRSQWIWAKGPRGPIYLNAEYLGVNGPTTKRELAIQERDLQRAADLNMFFYLIIK